MRKCSIGENGVYTHHYFAEGLKEDHNNMGNKSTEDLNNIIAMTKGIIRGQSWL